MFTRPILRMVLGNQDNEENNLYNRTERSLNQDTRHLRHLPRKLLAREAQKIGHRHHGDVASREDSNRHAWRRKVQYDSYNDERPKEVCVFCGIAARAPCYVDEVGWVEPFAPAFAIGMDMRRDDVVQQRCRLGIIVGPAVEVVG